MTDNFEPEYLTRKETAERYRINDKSLDYLVSTGQIPFLRVGRRNVRFRADWLLKWEEQQKNIEYHHNQRGEE